jgi:hypothetical protein
VPGLYGPLLPDPPGIENVNVRTAADTNAAPLMAAFGIEKEVARTAGVFVTLVALENVAAGVLRVAERTVGVTVTLLEAGPNAAMTVP